MIVATKAVVGEQKFITVSVKIPPSPMFFNGIYLRTTYSVLANKIPNATCPYVSHKLRRE